MGTLKSVSDFIESSILTASSIDERLNKIQAHFNSNFNNIVKVRTAEIEFLQNEFFKDPEKFPDEIKNIYKESLLDQEAKFKQNMALLEQQRQKLEIEIQELNKSSSSYFSSLKKVNSVLDKKEEQIKLEIDKLENEISSFNNKIDELNTGFGFISNFFNMKKIASQKEILLGKRDHLLAEIEGVRLGWEEKENKLLALDSEARNKWNDLYTEFSLTTEKIQKLTSDMDLLIKKAAFSHSLAILHGDEKFLSTGSNNARFDNCRKCSSKNGKNIFFCDFCGEPFSANRKDIEGSLIETGELNRVFRSLTEGIKQSVSFIALIRGIKEGMNTFLKSIRDVKKTEDTYSELPELKIDVPESSLKFSAHLKELEKKLAVEFLNLHPAEFAEKMFKETESLFTIKNIELFFTAMGDELNKRTKEQW